MASTAELVLPDLRVVKPAQPLLVFSFIALLVSTTPIQIACTLAFSIKVCLMIIAVLTLRSSTCSTIQALRFITSTSTHYLDMQVPISQLHRLCGTLTH